MGRRVLCAVFAGIVLAGGSVRATAAQTAQSPVPARLAAQAAGVVGSGAQLSLKLKLADGQRMLNVGEVFEDGWTLQALNPAKATLAKDGAVQEVGLNPSGSVAAETVSGPAAKVDVMTAEVQKVVDAQIAFDGCMAEFRAKTGEEFTPLSLMRARQVLGAARYAQCQAFSQVKVETQEQKRAVALARGQLNEVRRMDGLPPIGPSRITLAAAKTYNDADFPPGTFSPAGYVAGGALADGSRYLYRTLDDRLAAVAAGEEPTWRPGMTPAEATAARNAWIATHPNSSAR